jgi:CheY-like chemotaxis protein
MRAVIIEDHEVVATQLKQSIEELGHCVVGMASSFPAAVDMLMREPAAELAFIDLVLGDDADDASGVLLVDLATRRSMQVVVTTALTPIPDRLQGVALLTKPFSVEQISSVVASIAKSPDGSRHESDTRDMPCRMRA